MKNVKQIWKETTKRLEKVYEKREADNITYLLLEDVFGIKKADVLLEEEKIINGDLLNQSVTRLLQNEPIQYVTGFADFYGRRFRIQTGALIPRPETEELCKLIILENDLNKPRIMDIGAGSGCIAITLALELNVMVFATELSDKALEVARENSNYLKAKVDLQKSDAINEELPQKELDILVSNPPYIPSIDKADMHENVLKYEPELALFVSDSDPLIFYREIAEKGLDSLNPEGKLYFEIHERYGNEIAELLSEMGYSKVHIHKDMQGKDRMISATNSTNK